MNKFWVIITGFVLFGIVAAFAAGNNNSDLTIYDIETECREDREERTTITLKDDNSLGFEGYFPVENTKSNIDINYKEGQSIVLNVKSQSLPAPDFLWNNCLASGVYDLQTEPLNEGRYSVEVKHNGERAEKRIISVKN